ncbi:MAG: inorganic diphosphatase [Rhodospirillaceae bacterium]|nr:inorganic diphosphatase [Rhodospirillaceae bacterium]
MLLSKIAIGTNPPEDVNVIVEVPLRSPPVKYELDKESGALVVDRFLHTAMFYPGNYGFIPHTLSEDGDPCDVLVIGRLPVVPGAVLPTRPIGVLLMEDESGADEKILGVPVDKLKPFYNDVRTYTDMPPILLQEIEHFFSQYKALEPSKWVRVDGWAGVDVAHRKIREAIARAGNAT